MFLKDHWGGSGRCTGCFSAWIEQSTPGCCWISVCGSSRSPMGLSCPSPSISSNEAPLGKVNPARSASELLQHQKHVNVLFVGSLWCGCWSSRHADPAGRSDPHANPAASSERCRSPRVLLGSQRWVFCYSGQTSLPLLAVCPCCAETNLLQGSSPIRRTKGREAALLPKGNMSGNVSRFASVMQIGWLSHGCCDFYLLKRHLLNEFVFQFH